MAGRRKKSEAAVTPPAPGVEGAGATASVSLSDQPEERASDNTQPPASATAEVAGGRNAVWLRNLGGITRTEPFTKTRISPGETVKIMTGDIAQLRKNVAQINALARCRVLVEVEEQ